MSKWPDHEQREFYSLNRTFEPATGAHILDAVADDGTAWWMRLDGSEEDPQWTQLTPLPQPTFVEPTHG